jgi:hypothetical protein
MRFRRAGTIAAVATLCAVSQGLPEDAPANPGLAEALDAIVREACEYWSEEQFAQAHEMLVKSFGAPGLRKLGDEEREALLGSFRNRAEDMWRLRLDSPEFPVRLADLAWRFDCLFQREPPAATQVAAVCDQAKQFVAEVSEFARTWAGGPLKWFMDDTVTQVQGEAETAVRDPLEPGLKRLLTEAEIGEVKQRIRVRWDEEVARLDDRLQWIGRQEHSRVKTLQAMACESSLRSFFAAAQAGLASLSTPAPSEQLQAAQQAFVASLKAEMESHRKTDGEAAPDPVTRAMRRLADDYHPVVRLSEVALMSLDLSFLLRWTEGGDGLFIP